MCAKSYKVHYGLILLLLVPNCDFLCFSAHSSRCLMLVRFLVNDVFMHTLSLHVYQAMQSFPVLHKSFLNQNYRS